MANVAPIAGARGMSSVQDQPGSGPAGFAYLRGIAVCLAVGALTLLVLPARIAYDPWSWLAWGRELDHLSLVTAGGASAFKPLAAVIDAALAPAGSAAPQLWTVIVRGATILSLVLGFTIGRRVRGPGTGIVVALALLTIRPVSSGLALQGMAEPVEMCCCLAALECGLSGRRGAAVAWLVAASLLELELTGALILGGAWLLVVPAERRTRSVAIFVASLALVGAAWLVPGLVAGHGALASEAKSAADPVQGGPLLSSVPALAVFSEVRAMLFWPVVVGWAAELVVGVLACARRRSPPPLFVPALIAALVIAGIAVFTQLHGTTGTIRFLVAPCAVGTVAGVCLWGEVARTLGDLLARGGVAAGGAWLERRGPRRALGVAAGLAVVVGLCALSSTRLSDWRASMSAAIRLDGPLAQAQARLPVAVAQAGGPDALLDCGRVYTGSMEIPEVAWSLGVAPRRIWHSPRARATGSIVDPRSAPGAVHGTRGFRRLATGGRGGAGWEIYSTCRRRRHRR